jgi:hypothetical protein
MCELPFLLQVVVLLLQCERFVLCLSRAKRLILNIAPSKKSKQNSSKRVTRRSSRLNSVPELESAERAALARRDLDAILQESVDAKIELNNNTAAQNDTPPVDEHQIAVSNVAIAVEKALAAQSGLDDSASPTNQRPAPPPTPPVVQNSKIVISESETSDSDPEEEEVSEMSSNADDMNESGTGGLEMLFSDRISFQKAQLERRERSQSSPISNAAETRRRLAEKFGVKQNVVFDEDSAPNPEFDTSIAGKRFRERRQAPKAAEVFATREAKNGSTVSFLLIAL